MIKGPESASGTKILVSHFFSRYNKGDAALASTLVSELQRQFDHPEISILTLDKTLPDELFEGLPLESNFIYYSSFRFKSRSCKLAYALLMLSTTLVYGWCWRRLHIKVWLPKVLRPIMQRYIDADLIVAVGGGYLNGSKSFNSLYSTVLILHPFILSRLLGKPTVLFSQSYGPFKYVVERRLLGQVISRCVALALVREDQSMDFLATLGVTNAVRSVDTAFLLGTEGATSDLRHALGLPPEQLIVGVTVRDWLESSGQARYETSIAGVVDHLIARQGAFIVFIPQVTAAFFNDDDRVTARSVAKRVVHSDHVYLLEDELTCHELKAVYEDINFLIGTRFHSVIFSLTSHVPSLVIQYNHKASGIMTDLDLSEWVVNIEDTSTPKLIRMVDQLIESAQDYRTHLAAVIPPYVERAREAVELTQQAFNLSVARSD